MSGHITCGWNPKQVTSCQTHHKSEIKKNKNNKKILAKYNYSSDNIPSLEIFHAIKPSINRYNI